MELRVEKTKTGYRYSHILADGFKVSYTTKSYHRVIRYAKHERLSIVKTW